MTQDNLATKDGVVIVGKKITGYKVIAGDIQEVEEKHDVKMHEAIDRPERLEGMTFKIKPPTQSDALYITMNHIVLEDGSIHPFEIFVNSKNMDNFQWIVSQTRLISALFRKGGDVTFIIGEMKAVHQPNGGYFKKGGKYMNSLVAEIGHVIEEYLIIIGYLKPKKVDKEVMDFIVSKMTDIATDGKMLECPACKERAAIIMDGCLTCTSCGHSKCG
jgi:hypothetical protein